MLPLPEKLASCQALYRSERRRMLSRITPFCQPQGLDDWLAQRAHQRFEDTRVMVCIALSANSVSAWPDGLRLERLAQEAYAHIVGETRDTPPEGR